MSFRFEVGKEYYTRSICDSECIFKAEIISRTAKTVTIKNNMNKDLSKRKIHIYNNVEAIYPHGKYSMCAVISADKEVKHNNSIR